MWLRNSYAGLYVTTLAARVMDDPARTFNLVGIAMGDASLGLDDRAHSDPAWALSLQAFGNRNLYTGAPIFLGGRAVGALCAFTKGAKGGPPPEPDAQLRAALEDHAAQIGRIFARYVEASRGGGGGDADGR